MSTPLTDSINALTTYINETTGASDTTLSDAVGRMCEGYGGGDPLASINPLLDVICFRGEENLLPSTLTIDISNLRLFGLPDSWTVFSGLEHLIVTGEKKITTVSNYALGSDTVCNFHAQHCRGIKDITFVSGASLSGQLPGFFAYFNELEAIYGELDYTDVTAWTYNGPFANNYLLKHLRLKRDSAQTITQLAYDSLVALDDESLISIGNGLGVVTDTHNLALHSTKKTRCSSIMGSNDNGLFVADENGTMTLADFITNVKGWTLS